MGNNHSHQRLPYIYTSGNNHNRLCSHCGEELKEGDKVVSRYSHHHRHIGYELYGHTVHVRHVVDAKGKPIYDK